MAERRAGGCARRGGCTGGGGRGAGGARRGRRTLCVHALGHRRARGGRRAVQGASAGAAQACRAGVGRAGAGASSGHGVAGRPGGRGARRQVARIQVLHGASGARPGAAQRRELMPRASGPWAGGEGCARARKGGEGECVRNDPRISIICTGSVLCKTHLSRSGGPERHLLPSRGPITRQWRLCRAAQRAVRV